MDKKTQIKAVRQAEKELRQLLEETLKGPRAKENAAFLKKMLAEGKEEAKNDPAIYRINLFFKSDGCYEAELANLKNETADIDGIVIRNDDSLHLVCLSFLNRRALRRFRDEIDIGFMPSDSYEFKEFRRNRKGQWVFVTKPILWDEDRLG